MDQNQIRTVDPPIPISEYYDYTNGRHCYSAAKTPSTHGSYLYVGQPFQAYAKQSPGTIAVNEFYNPAKKIWAYSTKTAPYIDGFTDNAIAYYAFDHQVTGSVPLYQFYFEQKSNKKLYYDTYYSTVNSIPGVALIGISYRYNSMFILKNDNKHGKINAPQIFPCLLLSVLFAIYQLFRE